MQGNPAELELCGSGFGESLLDKDLLWWQRDFGVVVISSLEIPCGRTLTWVVALGQVWVPDVALLTLRLFQGTFQREEAFCSSEW